MMMLKIRIYRLLNLLAFAILSTRSKINRFAIITLALVLVTLSPLLHAAQSVNPDDARQLMRRENFSDPTGSDQWDMSQYISMEVIINDFIYPSQGYASILFTNLNEPGVEYRADTQLVTELKGRGINKNFLRKGGRAILYGWLKTQDNYYESIMLVDEIELVRRNGNNVFGKFHGANKGIRNNKGQCDLCLGPERGILRPAPEPVPIAGNAQ